MEIARCRLLPFAVADGPWNMAADEALLNGAEAGIASLRFYGWSPATLSLGYFQPAAERLRDQRLAALPWVRRTTGGEALIHDQELTYALALPAGAPWQRRGDNWPARIHKAIHATLGDLGVSTRLCDREMRQGEFLCFLHPTPGDLLLGNAKIAGSAQRKRRGALLQHGSILLAAAPSAPALPGIIELTGLNIRVEPLIAALRRQLSLQTGWALVDDCFTADELGWIENLGNLRYRASAWQEKR